MQFDLRDPPRGTEYHVPAGSTTEKTGNAVFRGHTGSVTTLSVSTDCRVLLSGSADANVHLWDIASRQIVRTITHKGSVTSARFAPAHNNFRAAVLQSKLQVRPLQRIADESRKDDIVEIISSRDDEDLLRIDGYLENDVEHSGRADNDASRRLVEARAEIDALKAKNVEMYQYAVKVLTSKAVGKKK